MQVNLAIRPAPENHGIRFIRTDLPNAPMITALFNQVVDTSLATVLGSGGCIVSTVEHLMAAFSGLSIDNVLVELDAYEMPIMDGSARPFFQRLRNAGVRDQRARKHFFVIKAPVELDDGDRLVDESVLEDYLAEHGRRNIQKRRRLGMVIQTTPSAPHVEEEESGDGR